MSWLGPATDLVQGIALLILFFVVLVHLREHIGRGQ